MTAVPPSIVPVYAALLALLFLALSINVIRGRRDAQVQIGAGGDAGLERRMRVQANFAEYVPLALLLLLMVELRGGPRVLLHACGAALLAGRLLHAWGVSRTPENLRFRIAGMMMTFGVLTVSVLAVLLG